ncbi:MAG: hypothetical protein WBG73_09715 [Coleofasciculaceae cyanobacterium]
MTSASKYWTKVKIDAAGNYRFVENIQAKIFFRQLFPDIKESDVPDTLVQAQLVQLMQISETVNNSIAKYCLQCFISYQTYQICQNLAIQFGTKHGFKVSDLLVFVLDDEPCPANSSYYSLQSKILDSFAPTQSSLATWTTRLVKHHKELNTFLLQCGVYLVSDWAILNDTSSKQLQRIFSRFHHLTSLEIQQASQLLESYHAVYRTQRLQQRQQPTRRPCLPPTTEQLQQIGKRLSKPTILLLDQENLLAQLQEIATRLREYRIHARGGNLATESINVPNSDASQTSNSLSFFEWIDNCEEPDEQTDFLNFYRQQLLSCLDQALEQVTNERVKYLERKDPEKAQKFLTALQLFHCQGSSMTEIASIINLPAQFNVSRLLNLKALRADVQQKLLVLLRDRISKKTKAYTNPHHLQLIEEALKEQITLLIQEVRKEASTPTKAKTHNTQSLFSKRICRLLDDMRTEK